MRPEASKRAEVSKREVASEERQILKLKDSPEEQHEPNAEQAGPNPQRI
jgi:hypothetical protein